MDAGWNRRRRPRGMTAWRECASESPPLGASVRLTVIRAEAPLSSSACRCRESIMIKIAIVEDHKATREGLETIINLSSGYRCVCTCASAEEALSILPLHRPEVVLMDIQLPNMSGVECVAQLKELLPSAEVIMVTVYEDPDRIFRALRAAASGYLLKRAAPDQVLSAIRDVQQGGAPMSGEIARKVIAHFQNP